MPERTVVTILSRPQISVSINEQGEVCISVTSISEAFDKVQMNEVIFPAECSQEIGEALLKIAGGE